MLTNAVLYRIDPLEKWVTHTIVDGLLQANTFVSTGSTQEKSCGFVPPRGHAHGPLIESINGQWIMKLMIETRSVPASAIARVVDEKLQQILESTGRKPGKKETRDLMDDARLALLPHAFPKQEATWIWIDPVARLMVVGASSNRKADDVVSYLVKTINGLAVHLLCTRESPTSAMTVWLVSQEALYGFSVDRECELRASDESKAVVRYRHHRLDTDEVKQHIQGGKLPTQLALTWRDRVSFVLDDGLQLKRIAFLDMVFEGGSKADFAADSFDADVDIMTGELSELISDLVIVLGGEIKA